MWIYWVGPLVGATMAVVATYLTHMEVEYSQPLATETPANTPAPNAESAGIQLQETRFVGDGRE